MRRETIPIAVACDHRVKKVDLDDRGTGVDSSNRGVGAVKAAWALETDPEHPVIEAVQRGDRYAFSELARRHESWVRGIIFGVLGDRDRLDDVAQQVWIRVWQQIGRLRDPKQWRTWVYRLARNAAVDAGRDRKRQRRLAREVGELKLVRPSVESAGESAVRQEQRAAVLEAIGSLSVLYREPFVLRHLQGWSYQEIADVMGMPVDTVETRLVRARRLLRAALKDKV